MIRRYGVALSAVALLGPFVLLGAAPATAATRSVSLSASTTVTTSGGLVTLSGRVAPAKAGVTVAVQHRRGSGWVTDRRVRTTSAGRYTSAARPTSVGTVTFRVVVPTQAWGRRTASPARSVTVRAAGSVTVEAPSSVRSDEQLAVAGTVSDGLAGTVVRLQRQYGSTWTSVVSATTTTAGRYRVTSSPKAATYRVVVAESASRTAATSSPFDVAVLQVRQAGGTVTSSTAWTSSSVSEIDLTDDLVVPADVTLRIGPDVTVNTHGHSVVVRGRLVAGQGGSTIFQATSGAREKAQWQGIHVVAGGTADLGGSLVQDAVVALDVDAGSSAVWHGTVRSSSAGLNADGFTDARKVDWGSSSGPSPYGTGAATRGTEAQVVPWAGYSVPPTRTAATQPATVCRDVVLLAARGSKEGPQDDGTYESDPYGGMGAIGYFAGAGALQTVLQQHPSATWDMRAIRYPASLYPGFTSGVTWPEYVNSLVQGAMGLRTAIRSLEASCPGSKVILIGASQGAGVVRLGIAGLTSAERESILAVGLVGDPLRTAGGSELLWQSADTPATAATLQRSGLLSADDLEEGASDAIPTDVLSRTVSLCRSDDIVCAAGPGSSVAGHVAYSSDDITALAHWLGAKALDGLS